MTTHDDTVLGRARVEDTSELESYYAELESLNAGALWSVANDIEPWEPVPSSEPVHWSYSKLRPHVLRAAELVTPEQAGRRVIWLANPARRDVAATCGWLFSGIQIMGGGERASAHRHAAAALRFIIEGEGAYTVVDGERALLGAKDFVITPAGTWHDHGNESDGGVAIWQDGLDIPFVNAMDANFYELNDEPYQSTLRPVDNSARSFVSSGLLPDGPKWSRPYSPLLRYPWARTRGALASLAAVSDGSASDGVVLRYCNPATGRHVMPTMGAQVQLLKPGQRLAPHRHTGNVIYTIAEGTGSSIVGGRRFDWAENDIFCVPSWTWHEHANASGSAEAVMFSFNDMPVMESLGLYREQSAA
jgi:gentisate 1,2-dioxygenase